MEYNTDFNSRFKTLLAFGKTLSTVGQIIIGVGGLVAFIGFVSFVWGDAISKPFGLIAWATGLLMVGLGYLIVANGQIISCFVSMEDNTHKTVELMNELKSQLPNFNTK